MTNSYDHLEVEGQRKNKFLAQNSNLIWNCFKKLKLADE